MLERQLGQRPGWMLVVSRVVIAATVFVLSASDAGNPGFETEPDDLLALAYLGFSIAWMAVHATNWWLAYRLRQFVFAVDFLNYVMIMFLIESMQSGYFAASITLLAFLTLSAAIQWGWKQAVITIVLLNLLCLAMIVEMLGMEMPVDWSSLLRRQAYQLLISFFLIWAAGWIQRPRVSAFTCPLGLEPADHYVRALEYARHSCWHRRARFAGQDRIKRHATLQRSAYVAVIGVRKTTALRDSRSSWQGLPCSI